MHYRKMEFWKKILNVAKKIEKINRQLIVGIEMFHIE